MCKQHIIPLSAGTGLRIQQLPQGKSSVTHQGCHPLLLDISAPLPLQGGFPIAPSYVSLFGFCSCSTWGGLGCTVTLPRFPPSFFCQWPSAMSKTAFKCDTPTVVCKCRMASWHWGFRKCTTDISWKNGFWKYPKVSPLMSLVLPTVST